LAVIIPIDSKRQFKRAQEPKVRHGLASGQIIIPGESQAEFDALLQKFMDEYKPNQTTQEMLVQQLAVHYWLKERAIRLQAAVPEGPTARSKKRLSVLMQYQKIHERGFQKTLSTLKKL
jgi:hypothetical protein